MLSCWPAKAANLYFVRHAEKVTTDPNNRDPELSVLGMQRADNLADLLSEAKITAIYSTPYQRTEKTAQPLAQRLGLEIKHYDPRAMKAFLDQLKNSEENTLIVGHSNTTPQAVAYLTQTEVKPLSEKDYGDVYQVIVSEDSVQMNHFRLPPQPNKTPYTTKNPKTKNTP